MRFLLAISVSLNVYAQDCTYQKSPDEYLTRQSRAYRQAFERTKKFPGRASDVAPRTVDPSTLHRANIIDHLILSKLEERAIPAAPVSSDEEFLRRITLDLTGRIPSPDDVRAFVASTDGDKRNLLI